MKFCVELCCESIEEDDDDGSCERERNVFIVSFNSCNLSMYFPFSGSVNSGSFEEMEPVRGEM